MENVIVKTNTFIEKELQKYMNYKYADLFLRQKDQQNIMVKSCDKNKHSEPPLIEDTLLKKELQLLLHEPSNDVPDLTIQNDVDFKLNAKEKTNKLATNNQNLKSKQLTVDNADTKTINTAKNNVGNDIIEIKCIQKVSGNHNTTKSLQCEDESEIIDHNEIYHNTEINQISSSDLKSELQSLLIMMAVSSTGSKPDNSNVQSKIFETKPVSEKHIKNKNIKEEREEQFPTCKEITDVLKIEALNIATYDESGLIRKYANRWMEYVKRKQRENSDHRRLANINNFFDRLEKRKASITQKPGPNKAKLQARDYNTYQHRYKVQKHIIALQKAKLEQQNRVIEQLKYNKIIDVSRQSLDCMKEDVRKTYYEIDKHLKPKIKCLTNELKIRDIDDTSLVLHCLKVPQFLQRMEARAREREEKHALIRERRKQIEEERVRLKQQAELAKLEMDKEEKAKRIKELREKRRKEKIENIRKKQHAERLRALIVMADLHYEKNLTAKYGIRPLKLLMQLKSDNVEKAKAFHQFQLKKNIFLHWMWYTEDMWYERNFKADEFYRKKLLKKTFSCFKENHKEYLLKMQVAKDYYDLYVTQLVFQKFREGILILKKEFYVKWNTAIIYYNSNLLFKTLTCWRTLPALNALKREQDARKIRWRAKVLQVVPDYVPPED
ncbi:uncharacterized protein [Epargyreus clarus]|uniref:uncharacterized protein n=1 Tax=Epargyreus clarus TaxID=520877 RepID=UPI003C2E64AA